MLVLGVIGIWLGCLAAFIFVTVRAPTLEEMPDHREIDTTDELVAELRRLLEQGRTAASGAGEVAATDRRRVG